MRLAKSATDVTAVTLPSAIIGDVLPIYIYPVQDGSYADLSGGTPRLALGTAGAIPTGGTFTLTYDGQTTTALAYNISAAAMQTALEALSNLAPGDVVVTGSAGGPWTITFGGSLADTDVAAITGSGASLTPNGNVTVNTLTAGGGGSDEVQHIFLQQNPLTTVTAWTPITNGWSGQLDLRVKAVVEALYGSSSLVKPLEIEITTTGGDIISVRYATFTIVGAIITSAVVADPAITSPLDQTAGDARYFRQQNPNVSGSQFLWQTDGSLKLFIDGMEVQHWGLGS